MKKLFTTTISLCLIFMLTGCSSDPNQKAESLYFKAVEHVQAMSGESYFDAFADYRKANALIDKILSEYQSLDIAVGLRSGEIPICGLRLSEFRNLENSLELMADLERELSSWGQLFASAMSVQGEFGRVRTLAVLATESGQLDVTVHLLSEAVKRANAEDLDSGLSLRRLAVKYGEKGERLINTWTDAWSDKRKTKVVVRYGEAGQFDQAPELAKLLDEFNKASTISKIAVKSSYTGQHEKAMQLLAQAEEKANATWDKSKKASLLIELANGYAEIGQNEKFLTILSRTFEIAKTIDDDYEFASLAYAASRYGSNEPSDSEKKARVLLKIVDSYIKAGEKDKAMQVISELRGTARRIGGLAKYDRWKEIIELKHAEAVRSDQVLAKTYAIKENGLLKSAEQVDIADIDADVRKIDQALKAAIEIEDRSKKIRLLDNIMVNYARVGQVDQAIETAKKIRDERNMLLSLVEPDPDRPTPFELDLVKIAGVLADSGLKPNHKDLTLLSELARIQDTMILFLNEE